MKIRQGFVSNSSSSSFIIHNKSIKELTIVDFVCENPQLIEKFKDRYGYKDDPNFTQEYLIQNAKDRLGMSGIKYAIPPQESKRLVFGDEEGDLIGHVFDYILREEGESENFSWYLRDMLR